jgi:hypothetical protein
MLSKRLAFVLACGVGLALAGTASAADDVIRLALPNKSADVLTLGATASDLDADVLNVARYGGGYRGGYVGYRGGYGGYRGGYYGGYRGYRGGYYGGYRGGYYGGYRGYYGGYRYGYAGYRYRGYGYGGYGYGGYYPYYGYAYYPSYSYYSPSYSYYYPSSSYYDTDYSDAYGSGYGTYYPSSLSSRVVIVRPSAPVTSYPQQQPQAQPRLETLPNPSASPAPQQMPGADEDTFPYDGGPKNPVPMPQSSEDAKPTVVPYGKLYPKETLVSLKPKAEQKTSGKWNYPAYGEKPTRGK